jgi:hypothetical protein
MTRRIERAMLLLRRGDLSVTDVCMAVGCTSLGSFSTRFTELVRGDPERLPGAQPRCSGHRPRLLGPKVVTRPSRNREAQVSPAFVGFGYESFW